MTKIFITYKIPEICKNMLIEKGFDVHTSDKSTPLSQKELLKEIATFKYDGLITLLTDKIDKTFLNNCVGVKIIANYAVGLNNIDQEAAKEKNIFVANAKNTSANAVAQHTIALILSLYNRLGEGEYFVRKKLWRGWKPEFLIGEDLHGKTVGLVGTGNIGGKVAEILVKGFNCKIIYTDMNVNTDLETKFSAEKVDLDTLLESSDIVSLHVPLTKETTHLIDLAKLKKMRKNAIIINTARGPIVSEKDLVYALKNKIIAGAGLDVFEFEPEVSKELLTLKQVVLTPHIASAKKSAREEMAIATANNIIDFFVTQTTKRPPSSLFTPKRPYETPRTGV
jgi:glyoxylate reductase